MSAPLKPVLAGNWKMHLGPSEAARFFDEFLAVWQPRDNRTVAIFPPAISLAAAREALQAHHRGDVLLGLQKVHGEPRGAYTGEISAPMAADAGASLVLVGHSECRWIFGETIEETVQKVRAILDAGMVPVLCVGEKIEERSAGRAEDVVEAQLKPVLETLSFDEARSLVIAYEPVWAIGTGVNATPDDAGVMHGYIRRELSVAFGREVSAAIPVLYGGSVKPENAAELLAVEGVDGVLVGGASLDPHGFAKICGAA